eukprot:4739393-Amphidinium_carterae.1
MPGRELARGSLQLIACQDSRRRFEHRAGQSKAWHSPAELLPSAQEWQWVRWSSQRRTGSAGARAKCCKSGRA